MKSFSVAWRLLASAMVLAASSGANAAPEDALKALQAQVDALKKQGTYTVNTGSLAIESWLLSSTAVQKTADKIQTALLDPAVVDKMKKKKRILVTAGTEAPDFSLAPMMELEIEALTDRLRKACQCGDPGTVQVVGIPAAIGMFGAIAGLLKSDTELTAIAQTVDAKLLAAAVAEKLDAALPAAAVTLGDSQLIKDFNSLVRVADEAQAVLDSLSGENQKLTEVEKAQKARLTALLARYEAFYTRVTTANAAGAVPLVTAARLQNLIKDKPYILHVNTEGSGGTLLKRTNILTALGAESVFISAGLVSSYQLTDPEEGKVIKAGLITCRTTLTTLKRVQAGSWTNAVTKMPEAVCLP
jgi:hypothetical protein